NWHRATLFGKNAVELPRLSSMIFGEEAMDIHAPAADGQRPARDLDCEAVGSFFGHHRPANDVGGLSPPAPIGDVNQFVPVGVKLHAALLHQHATEVLFCIKSIPAVIATHRLPLICRLASAAKLDSRLRGNDDRPSCPRRRAPRSKV